MNSVEIERLLSLGRSTAEAGQWVAARRYFAQVLSIDPTNEEALLWLAGLADDPRQSIAYLKRVLRRNPDCKRAQAGLRWAQQRLQTAQPLPQAGRRRQASLSFYLWSGLLAVLLMLCLIFGAFAVASKGILYALLFSPANTPAATPSSIPTATVTSTPTSTSTATPTLTSTPSPSLTWAPLPTAVMPLLRPLAGEKWIDIDLSTQTLVAYEGEVEVFRAIVSTGTALTPTVTGQFRIFHKLLSQTMVGPDYVQPNVPYVMYFHKGYSLHGTYWHNDFGWPRSHGCVNLRITDAKWLFEWTDPPLPPGAAEVWDTVSGTLVVIHD